MKWNRVLMTLSASLLLASCGNESTDEQAASEDQATEETAEVEETEQEQAGSYFINPASWRVEPVEGSDAESQVVLMTFDDSPDKHAVEMAHTLKEHDVPAIFFVNGMYLESDEGKAKLQEIYDLGFAIGNHTHTHPNLQTIPEDQQREEIVQTNDLVEEIIGERPRFFRAPFGANTDYTQQVADEEGMILMNWSYGYDWEQEYTEPNALADIMVNTEFLTDGANLLMHDREWTSQALPAIIQGFEEKGYGFVNPNNIESGQIDEN